MASVIFRFAKWPPCSGPADCGSVNCKTETKCVGLRRVTPPLLATLKGHTDAVVAVAFGPDSKTLASASYDGTLKLWDMTTGKERATLGEYTGCLGCVAFSADGDA